MGAEHNCSVSVMLAGEGAEIARIRRLDVCLYVQTLVVLMFRDSRGFFFLPRCCGCLA